MKWFGTKKREKRAGLGVLLDRGGGSDDGRFFSVKPLTARRGCFAVRRAGEPVQLTIGGTRGEGGNSER